MPIWGAPFLARLFIIISITLLCTLVAAAYVAHDVESDPDAYDVASNSNQPDDYDEEYAEVQPTTSNWLTTSRVQTANGAANSGCQVPLAYDCRCVYQHALAGFKVTCEQLGLQSIPAAIINNLPARTVHLSLRRNMIWQIRKSDLRNVSSLQVLDLSNNLIDSIEAGSFESLVQLSKLNLSENRLTQINASLFAGLTKLARLSLSANRLPTIPRSVIRSLLQLRTIDFSSTSLICDCRLKWVVEYATRIRIEDSPVCAKPPRLKNKRVRKLAFDQLGCDSDDQSVYDTPNSPIFLELSPSREQLSLQGDSLSLTCRANNLIEAQLQSERSRLYWENTAEPASPSVSASTTLILPGEHADGLTVVNYMHSDPQQSNSYQYVRQNAESVYAAGSGAARATASAGPNASPINSPVLFWSELTLRNLETQHSGLWKCVLTTPVGNFSKSVNVRVLGRDLAQCEPQVVLTTRGMFSWQRTLASMASSLPCPLGAATVNSNEQQPLFAAMDAALAHFRCDTNGRWTQLDLTACRHVSQIDEIIRDLLAYRIDASNTHQLLNYVQRILVHAKSAIGVTQLHAIVNLVERTAEVFRDAANSSLIGALGPLSHRGSERPQTGVAWPSSSYSAERHNLDDADAFDRLFASVELIGSLDATLLRAAEARDRVATRLVRLVQDVAYSQVLLNRNIREFARSTASFTVVALRVPTAHLSVPWLACRILASKSSSGDARRNFTYHCELSSFDDEAEQNKLESEAIMRSESESESESDALYTAAHIHIPLRMLINDAQLSSELDREASLAVAQPARKLYETNFIVQHDAANGRKSRRPVQTEASSDDWSSRSALEERSVLLQFAYFTSSHLFPALEHARVTYAPQSGFVVVRIGGLQSLPARNTSRRVHVRLGALKSRSSVSVEGLQEQPVAVGQLTALTLSLLPHGNFSSWLNEEQCSLAPQTAQSIFTSLRCPVFGMWVTVAARSVRWPLPSAIFVFDSIVYVGALASVACVLLVATTYLCCRRAVNMNYRLHHAIVNWNGNFVALVATFLFGILRTENVVVCTTVGAAIHFLTLCLLCWFTVWSLTLFRKSRKFRNYMKQFARYTATENSRNNSSTNQAFGSASNHHSSAFCTPSNSANGTPLKQNRLPFAITTLGNSPKRDVHSRSKMRQQSTDETQPSLNESLLPIMSNCILSCSEQQPQPALTQSFIVRSRVQASRKVTTSRWKKLVRLYVFAYGVPAFISGVTLSLSMDSYIQGHCAPVNLSLWAPSSLLIALNVMLLVSTLTSVCTSSADLERCLTHFKRHRRAYQRQALAAAANSLFAATCASSGDVLHQSTTTSSRISTSTSGLKSQPQLNGLGNCALLNDPTCSSLLSDSDFSSVNAPRSSVALQQDTPTITDILLFIYNSKQSNKEQFCTLLTLHVLFAASWCFAALCVVETLDANANPLAQSATLRARGLVFAYLFAICVTAFGVVTLVYFVVLRSDVRSAWTDVLKLRLARRQRTPTSVSTANGSPRRQADQDQASRQRKTEKFDRIREPQPGVQTARVSQPSFVEPMYAPVLYAAKKQTVQTQAQTQTQIDTVRPPAAVPVPVPVHSVEPSPGSPCRTSQDAAAFAPANGDLLTDVVQSVARSRLARNHNQCEFDVSAASSGRTQRDAQLPVAADSSKLDHAERLRNSQISIMNILNNGNLVSNSSSNSNILALAPGSTRPQNTYVRNFAESPGNPEQLPIGNRHFDAQNVPSQSALPAEDDYIAVAVRRVVKQPLVEANECGECLDADAASSCGDSEPERRTKVANANGKHDETRV